MNNPKYESIHKQQVRQLRSRLGNVALTDATLNRECRKLFGSKFLGVKMQNSQVPNRDGYMIMNNDYLGGSGEHWLAIIKRGGDVFIYDSFGRLGRNILPSFVEKMNSQGFRIHNADTSDQDQYGYKSVDCGHRCISALMIADTYGVNAFLAL